MSQINQHDLKIWWYISLKNVGVAMKLCRLSCPVAAIISNNILSFHRSWLTEKPSLTDVVYLWRDLTTHHKRHGLKNSFETRQIAWRHKLSLCSLLTIYIAKYKSSYGVSELGNNSRVPRLRDRLITACKFSTSYRKHNYEFRTYQKGLYTPINP